MSQASQRPAEAGSNPVEVTAEAARHVAEQLRGRGSGLGVRLGVRTSGCSGLAYHLEYVDRQQPEDLCYEQHGVRFFVDPKSRVYLQGSRLCFVREGVNAGLEFENPNAVSACGCGESFHVDEAGG